MGNCVVEHTNGGVAIRGVFAFGSLALHGARIWKFGAYYAAFFLITAFFEDFLMRGYSQWVLSRGMNFWPTAALLSCTFGAIHGSNPGEAKTGLVAAGCIGFFLCLTLRRTGDLWWPSASTWRGTGARVISTPFPTADRFSPATCSTPACTVPSG